MGVSIHSLASPLHIQYSGYGTHLPHDFEPNLHKAYNFVATRLKDPIDREKCPVQIEFTPLVGMVGFTPKVTDSCKAVVQIDLSLEGKSGADLVLAHEMVHVIRNIYNKQDAPWLEEGIAKFFEVQYLGAQDQRLKDRLDLSSELRLSSLIDDFDFNGGAFTTAFYFTKYLHDHFEGNELLRELVQSPLSGWDALTSTFQKLKQNGKLHLDEKYFEPHKLWSLFAVAMIMNKPILAPKGLLLIEHEPYFKSVAKTSTRLILKDKPEAPMQPWTIRYFTRDAFFANPNYYVTLLDQGVRFYAINNTTTSQPSAQWIKTADELSSLTKLDFEHLVAVSFDK